MSSWRLAKSLEVLRSQIDMEWPNRNRVSDGTIGDAAHARVVSDHNPNAAGVVTALDITHDPVHLDAHELAEALREKPHPDCKYIISNYRIAGPFTTWLWGSYDGIDPHDAHIHVSVGRGPDGNSTPPYDDTNKWNVKGGLMAVRDSILDEVDEFNLFIDICGRAPLPHEKGRYVGKTHGWSQEDCRKNATRKTVDPIFVYVREHNGQLPSDIDAAAKLAKVKAALQ